MRQLATEPTLLTLSASSATPSYAATATITGLLKEATAPNAPIAGKAVVLQKLSSGATWTDVGSTLTGGDGSVAFGVKQSLKTSYRLSFAGVAGSLQPADYAALVITPRVGISTPAAPKTMKRSKYYSVYGFLKPRHTAGTRPVRIYKYKKVNGRWKSYGYVKAKASNYKSWSRYSVKMRLASRGSWRLRAYAPADSRHAATWSSKFDYARVK